MTSDPEWENAGCSVLEMFYAFAERAEFQTGEPAYDWFWTFVDNLRMTGFNDASSVKESDIQDILNRLIWRTYDKNGRGGMFPLRSPSHDQTQLEIWYQFCEFLIELEE
jgi:hypothetical protein